MNVVVLIPVGPGHEKVAQVAVASVRCAWQVGHGPFAEMAVRRIPDPQGALGRSAARNRGLDLYPADWHFLLDADDVMMANAFGMLDPTVAATFGAVCLMRGGAFKVVSSNVYPVTRETLFKRGAAGTLTMGCFVRGDLGLRFNETLDLGEDFDFYMRLPGFTKRKEPLVAIGYDLPSASGPRTNPDNAPWTEVCNAIIARYRGLEVPSSDAK